MIEDLKTFINRNGFPMIRRCENCKFWHNEIILDGEGVGYCKFKPLYFAHTLTPTVYAMTKKFYLCENHAFLNEEKLKEVCQIVNLKEVLKKGI